MLASVQSIERPVEENVIRMVTQPLLASFRVAPNPLGIEYGVMPLTETVVMRLRQVAELCQQHQLVSAEISDIPVQWVRRGRRYVAYITGIQVFDSACCCFTAFFSILPSGEIPDECECQSDDQLKPWFSPLPRRDGELPFQHVNVEAFWLPAAKSMSLDALRNVANFAGEVWNMEDIEKGNRMRMDQSDS